MQTENIGTGYPAPAGGALFEQTTEDFLINARIEEEARKREEEERKKAEEQEAVIDDEKEGSDN